VAPRPSVRTSPVGLSSLVKASGTTCGKVHPLAASPRRLVAVCLYRLSHSALPRMTPTLMGFFVPSAMDCHF
jgi:hypothetical protein